VTQQLTPGASVAQVGTTFAQQSVGAAYTATSGTITTATSTVTTGNVGLAGNITAYIFGTYAGVTVNFEVSPDNTNWFAWPMQREQTGAIEQAPVLAANTAASWTIDAPGFSFFRVRASAWTSGTANVIINPGSYPITPVVSSVVWQPSTKVPCGFTSALTMVAAETLVSLTPVRGVTAGTAGTTMTVTTGKTLRITAISLGIQNVTTAGVIPAVVSLRARASGTVTTTDPKLWGGRVANPAATLNTVGTMHYSFPDGIDLPSGSTFGISENGLVNGILDVSINGYEF
jgi:hypothetical protein